MNRKTLIFVMTCCLAPAAARSQSEPDMIAVRAVPDASGRGSIAWSLDSGGAVELTTSACAQCRNPAPRHRTFAISAAEAARLLSRLPKAEVESALHAPCTLPYATSGWAREVDLRYRLSGRAVFTGFFGRCRSPQLDQLSTRLRETGEALIALEPAATREH